MMKETDCIGSCQSNYHKITTPKGQLKKKVDVVHLVYQGKLHYVFPNVENECSMEAFYIR